ncbi:MAG: ThiF family adenylyltransferase [Pseudomonadota bacterium]
MQSAFTLKNSGYLSIEDRVVFVQGTPVGIICPSALEGNTLLGYDRMKNKKIEQKMISGPLGTVKIDSSDLEDNFRGLVKTGSIIFGEPDDVYSCNELLKSPDTSRTASFFCSMAKTVGEVIAAFKNIYSSKVAIIGCGGIGSLTAFNLSGSGIKEMKIIDGDVIEKSNLNRQFFWRLSDVGELKTKVLKRELEARYSGSNIVTYDEHMSLGEASELTKNYDLVILTADEPLGVGEKELSDEAEQDGKS